MDDLEMEIHKIKQPPCLSAVKVFCLTEVCQVLVVSEDLDGEEGPVEIVSLGFQSTDDCEEFSVVDVVVLFSWDE